MTPEKLTNWELEEKYKNLPRQIPVFKKHDRVITPVGNMIVVDPTFSHQLINNEWIPCVRLGFITSKLGLHKTKKHRFFTQDRLQKLS